MNCKDIYENVKYLELFNAINAEINNVTIDTRKVVSGDCYIGIKGENFDGNLLYEEAFEKGATLAILENITVTDSLREYLIKNNKSIVLVENTIEALGQIAKYKRSLFTNPVVAITGSAGKTSTKDMVYSVLKQKLNVKKTIGNQNNHIGLPLTMMKLDKSYDALVLEMGMNHRNEISYLTKIARPNIAIITNVGTAHIGNLGSRENILKAKLEILEGLEPNGILIINNDNNLLHEWYLNNNHDFKVITVGIKNKSDYMALNIKELENGSYFTCNDNNYFVPAPGEHFIYNSLVAIAVANIFNISYELVKNGIKDFELSSNRMHLINLNGIMVIDDSYNANYDSMSYAIKYLGSLSGRNIAVLGTMKELGDYSSKIHLDIGALISKEEIDILVTVGDEAKYINEGAIQNGFSKSNSYHFDSNDDAIKFLNEIKKNDDNILIKASNSLKFKEIVEGITKNQLS